MYILNGWTIGPSSGTMPIASTSGPIIPNGTFRLWKIEEALHDLSRIETEVPARQAHQVIGRTAAGRWLVVIWIDDRAGRYPIHAREASNRIIRRISK